MGAWAKYQLVPLRGRPRITRVPRWLRRAVACSRPWARWRCKVRPRALRGRPPCSAEPHRPRFAERGDEGGATNAPGEALQCRCRHDGATETRGCPSSARGAGLPSGARGRTQLGKRQAGDRSPVGLVLATMWRLPVLGASFRALSTCLDSSFDVVPTVSVFGREVIVRTAQQAQIIWPGAAALARGTVMVDLQPGGAAAALPRRVGPATAESVPFDHRTSNRTWDMRGSSGTRGCSERPSSERIPQRCRRGRRCNACWLRHCDRR